MTCTRPVTAYQPEGGGRLLFTNRPDLREVKIPCGKCISCRLEYSRQWAVRMMHEMQLHDQNCSITLTYDADNVPKDAGLKKRDYQLYMKRLRKRTGKRIRFFHCGEYGEKNLRPHYHAILFGYMYPDLVQDGQSPTGYPLYSSRLLESDWGMGRCRVGEANFETAAYCARYITKKITGNGAEVIGANGLRHYERYDSESGEIVTVQKEYCTMSNRPGIGHDWLRSYERDCFPSGTISVNGLQVAVPKYYKRIALDEDGVEEARMREEVKRNSKPPLTTQRLKDIAAVKAAQHKQLKRNDQ